MPPPGQRGGFGADKASANPALENSSIVRFSKAFIAAVIAFGMITQSSSSL
jgi:hypothetical protein